jgi:hypothetical protein
MYRLEIMGPKGRQVLEWDPCKLQERDPNTVETVTKADRLFKEAVAYSRSQGAAVSATAPQMAISGRWSA